MKKYIELFIGLAFSMLAFAVYAGPAYADQTLSNINSTSSACITINSVGTDGVSNVTSSMTGIGGCSSFGSFTLPPSNDLPTNQLLIFDNSQNIVSAQDAAYSTSTGIGVTIPTSSPSAGYWLIGMNFGTGGGTSTWPTLSSALLSAHTQYGAIYGQFNYVPPSSACGGVQTISISPPSGTIQNDFNSWTANTTPLDEGCSYGLQVSWYSNYQGSLYTHLDATTTYITIDTSNTTFSIPKALSLWPSYGGSTTTYSYLAALTDQTAGDPDQGAYLGSAAGTFDLVANASSSLPLGASSTLPCIGIGSCVTGGGLSGIIYPSSTIAQIQAPCPQPAGLLDIGGGISYGFCSTINFLFVPASSTQDIANGDMKILETVPPFAWFFQVNGAIGAAANGDTQYQTPNGSEVYTINPNASTSLSGAVSSPNNGLSFSVPNLDGSSTSVNLIPADLTTNSFLSTPKGVALVDDYYNFILTAAIIAVVLMVYKIIL